MFEVPVEIISAAIETCGYAKSKFAIILRVYLVCLKWYLNSCSLHGTRADREQFQKTFPEDLAHKAVDEEVQGTGKRG